jgi:hypothetical protein
MTSQDNTQLLYAIVRSRKKFEALRMFTLENGQAELEWRNRRRKEAAAGESGTDVSSRRGSVESLTGPATSQTPRASSLSDVPEDGTFAIGDEDDSDEDARPTPAASSPGASQASPVTGQAEEAVPTQLRGMSEKARGKMRADAHSFSRQNSTTSLGGYSAAGQSHSGEFEPTTDWIDSWLPEIPLHTILAVIQQLSAILRRQDVTTDHASSVTLQKIGNTQIMGIEPSDIRVHSFEWSQLALGWYESLIWSFIFSSEMQVAKGTIGIWNGTAIKLFRVQETAAQGPSFTSPRGAVDAVGSNIVSRIGALNLRGASTANAGTGNASAAPLTTTGREGSARSTRAASGHE